LTGLRTPRVSRPNRVRLMRSTCGLGSPLAVILYDGA
jgi:hypothetical protein